MFLVALCLLLVAAHGQHKDPYQPSIENDRKAMERALSIASRGNGKTKPNPCVGCVILNKEGEVVGEGWHRKVGERHAEVVALERAGHRENGGTAYVSLEPCNHFGRTPPCTLALLK